MVLMEKLAEVAASMAGIAKRLDALETTKDDEDDEDESNDDDDDSADGLAQQFGGLISEPKYSNIFRGLLTGNPDTIRETIVQAAEKEPEVFTELIGKCIAIILA